MGEIVSKWLQKHPLESQSMEKQKSPFAPRNNETNEEKEKRKEEMEKAELIEEEKIGLKRVGMQLNFRNWGVLNKKYILCIKISITKKNLKILITKIKKFKIKSTFRKSQRKHQRKSGNNNLKNLKLDFKYRTHVWNQICFRRDQSLQH